MSERAKKSFERNVLLLRVLLKESIAENRTLSPVPKANRRAESLLALLRA